MIDKIILSKKDFLLLEKVFAAELSGHLPFQSRSKQYDRLQKEGYVNRHKVTLRGGFPVMIEGWILTLLGHYVYCSNCEEQIENHNKSP